MTTTTRTAYTPAVGEALWDTDLNELFVGNGSTAGGISVSSAIPAIVTKTTNYSVTSGDSGTHFNDNGASGTVTFSLPSAAIGLRYIFTELSALNFILQVNGTDLVYIDTNVSSAGGTVTAGGLGSSVSIECPAAGIWVATSVTGAWTPA